MKVTGPLGPVGERPRFDPAITGRLVCEGASRCGRSHCVTAIRMPVKTIRVAAIAGRVRRMIIPAVTPTTSARAA